MPVKIDEFAYPLFNEYGLDELHRRLGYEYSYLSEIAKGRRIPSRRFILTACGILNRTEEELFGEEEQR